MNCSDRVKTVASFSSRHRRELANSPFLVFGVFAFVVSFPGEARATPIFFGSVQIRSDRAPVTDSGPASATVGPRIQTAHIPPAGFIGSEGRAAAIRGSLSAFAHGRASGAFGCFSFAVLPKACGAASASASMSLDDILITGPSDTVVASLNFNLAGRIGASARATSDLVVTAVSEMGFGVSLSASALGPVSVANGHILAEQVDFAGTSVGDQQFLRTRFEGKRGPFGTGETNGESGLTILSFSTSGGNIETNSTTLPVGVPITLNLSLGVSAAAVLGGGGDVNADSLFFDTLSFPGSGPVFNLPTGYSVNSIQGLIRDNVWLGGTPPGSAPEPGTLALVAIGVAGLGFRRRRP